MWYSNKSLGDFELPRNLRHNSNSNEESYVMCLANHDASRSSIERKPSHNNKFCELNLPWGVWVSNLQCFRLSCIYSIKLTSVDNYNSLQPNTVKCATFMELALA